MEDVRVRKWGGGGERKRSWVGAEDGGGKEEELLPGILDEITMTHIVAKLPWKAIQVLQLVSPKWRRAVQSRQVHDARVASGSTETFFVVLLNHVHHLNAIAVYSPQTDSCFFLPSIPGKTAEQFLGLCKCLCFGGRVYLLVNFHKDLWQWETMETRVYMLDLAGERTWKRCASMQHARAAYGCGILDGKIYAFGGLAHHGPVLAAEVYDPVKDVWSDITPKPSAQHGHHDPGVGSQREYHVVTMAKKLFVVMRETYERVAFEAEYNVYLNFGIELESEGCNVKVYCPVNDRWRVLKHFASPADRVFMRGKSLHRIRHVNHKKHVIEQYDVQTKEWKHWRSFVLNAIGPRTRRVKVHAVVAADNVIYAEVTWTGLENKKKVDGTCILRSQELFNEDEDILWKKTSLQVGTWRTMGYSFMVPVDL